MSSPPSTEPGATATRDGAPSPVPPPSAAARPRARRELAIPEGTLRVAAGIVAALSVAGIGFNLATHGLGVTGILWLVAGAVLLAGGVWALARGEVSQWVAGAVTAAALLMLVYLIVRLSPSDPEEWIRFAWLLLVLVVTAGLAIIGRRGASAPPPASTLSDLMEAGEGETVEYKSSLRWDVREERVNRGLQQVVAKSVAGFLNAQGGTLLIGVDDHGAALGIERDLQTLQRKDLDGFEQLLRQVLIEHLGAAFMPLVTTEYKPVAGRTVALVRVRPAPEPAFLRGKRGSEFVVRIGNATRPLDVAESHAYITRRWP